jgi:hypothetical protein
MKMKSQSYMTRALKARDPRFARILGKMGYAGAPVEEPKKVKKVPKSDERTMLRAEYERVMKKRPFSGWDATELRTRIADATKDEDAAKAAAAGDNQVTKIATAAGPDDPEAAKLANAKKPAEPSQGND